MCGGHRHGDHRRRCHHTVRRLEACGGHNGPECKATPQEAGGTPDKPDPGPDRPTPHQAEGMAPRGMLARLAAVAPPGSVAAKPRMVRHQRSSRHACVFAARPSGCRARGLRKLPVPKVRIRFAVETADGKRSIRALSAHLHVNFGLLELRGRQ